MYGKESCGGGEVDMTGLRYTMSGKRKSYTLSFKLEATEEARRTNNNRATAAKYGVDEKSLREWRKQYFKLKQMMETYDGQKRRRLDGSGQKPTLGVVEEQLASWIRELTAAKFAVTNSMIKLKALELNRESGDNPGFVASRGWLHKFLHRWKFVGRGGNAESGSSDSNLLLPPDGARSVARFLRSLRALRISERDDVVPAYLIGSTCMADVNCDATTKITVMLTAMADGVKLPPMVIFQGGSRMPDDLKRIAERVPIVLTPDGCLNEQSLLDWFHRCWGFLAFSTRILVADEHPLYAAKSVTRLLTKMTTKLVSVPSDYVCVSQPGPSSWTPPFRRAFEALLKEYDDSRRASGNGGSSAPLPLTPSKSKMAEWALTSWDKLDSDVIRTSFRTCGISLDINGSEDQAIDITDDPQLTSSVQKLLSLEEGDEAIKSEGGYEDDDDDELVNIHLVDFE